MAVAFGLRISEAVAVKESDFIGHEELEDLKSRGDFISRLVEKGKGFLFLNVNKAEKRTITKDVLKILGDNLDLEPKSGPYTACCTHEGIAEFILELLEGREHLQELGKDEVYKFMNEVGFDTSGFNFHLYRPHDDRRLNITLQCLDLSLDISDVIETVCFLHGQSSRDVFNRYFQWGLTQIRISNRKKGSKLRVIKTG